MGGEKLGALAFGAAAVAAAALKGEGRDLLLGQAGVDSAEIGGVTALTVGINYHGDLLPFGQTGGTGLHRIDMPACHLVAEIVFTGLIGVPGVQLPRLGEPLAAGVGRGRRRGRRGRGLALAGSKQEKQGQNGTQKLLHVHGDFSFISSSRVSRHPRLLYKFFFCT